MAGGLKVVQSVVRKLLDEDGELFELSEANKKYEQTRCTKTISRDSNERLENKQSSVNLKMKGSLSECIVRGEVHICFAKRQPVVG